MRKYKALKDFLKDSEGHEVHLTFRGIESILGSRLPPSAYKRREWWANNAIGHSHARAWLEAGFRTVAVDMEDRRLIFRRAGPPAEKRLPVSAAAYRPAAAHRTGPKRHPAFGALKGTVRLDPDFDPASPVMPEKAAPAPAQYVRNVP